MACIGEVIERVERMKASAFEDESKAAWLMELDGKLFDFFSLYEPDLEGARAQPPRAFPEDADLPLLVAAPYDNLYELYLCAMIDFHNREYGSYNNTVAVYTAALDEFKQQHHRTHRLRGGNGFVNVM